MKSIVAFILFILVYSAQAQTDVYNATLDAYKYPYPVKHFEVSIEGQSYKMAYMDVAPEKKVQNPQTVLLLHGKNFIGAYWVATIKYLTKNGFRVIVPDQVGFGKSDKPEIYYTFHQLAQNTFKLLESL